MDIRELFSTGHLFDRLTAALRRFPLTAVFIVSLFAFTVAVNHNSGKIVSERFTFFCFFYLSTGGVLSLSLRLRDEDRRGLMRHVVSAVVHALWLAASVYLAYHYPFDIMTGWGCFALCTAVMVSLCQLPFIGRPNDLSLWNFTLSLLSSAAVVGMLGLLLYGGIAILLSSFEHLFGLDISYDVYLDAAAFCGTFLCPLLFILLIPSGSGKHDDSVMTFTGFGKGVIHFLFIPLQAAYLITLYIYAAKIFISWELPDGWVTWLVSVAMLGMLTIICVVHPMRFAAGMRFDKWLMRWLPLMMLPLLLLMTAGTVRRVGDYGITVWRFYLIAFNVWCYAVCGALFLTRSSRIWWIPASFSAVLLVSSVGPQSFANITRTVLAGEITACLAAAGYTRLPLNGKEYKEWIDKEADGETNSKIMYLRRHYNNDALTGIIASGVRLDYALYGRVTDRSGTVLPARERRVYSAWGLSEPTSVPRGYTRMVMADAVKELTDDELKNGSISVSFVYETDSVEIIIPVSRLKEYSTAYENEKGSGSGTLVLTSPESSLFVKNYSLNLMGRAPYYFTISGILFLR